MDVASKNEPNENGPTVSLWCEAALIAGAWQECVRLTFTQGRISRVEPQVPRQPGDRHYAVALPGSANLHSHAFQRGMAGLAETRGFAADSFWTWREVMYHFLDRLTPDDLEAIAALAYVEMLEAGFTRVGEFHYVHHDCDGSQYDNPAELAERICAAAQTTGINLTLLPSFYAHADFGGKDPVKGQRRFIQSLDGFARLLESAERSVRCLAGANLGVAPHSLRAATHEELKFVVALAGGRPIHIHAAEQVKEVDDCRAATGTSPVAWLLDNFPVDHHWCLVHATHMTPDEVTGLAGSGATVGLCPITEANLGDGIFPAVPFVAQGGHYGIGTDANVNIDLAGELCQLEYSQRLSTRARNVLARSAGCSTGRSLFDRARVGGCRALHAAANELNVGDPADVVLLAGDHAALSPRERGDTVLDRFIFGGRHRLAVDSVWVGGKCLVSEGRHLRREVVAAAFRATLHRLLTT